MENHDLQKLLNSYSEQTASPQEVQRLLSYFDIEEDGEFMRETIRRKMEEIGAGHNVLNLDDYKIYSRVEKTLAARIDREQGIQEISSWPRKLYTYSASAAAMLLMLGGYYLWQSSRPLEMKTVYAAYGKQLEVRLPDSSKVWLNAGSTLIYPVAFNSKIRTITLKEGEAYFEITHDVHRSFVVHTKNVDVSVLGTSFEISAYEKEREAKVTVNTGKVGLVQPMKDALFLLPGDRALINSLTHQIHKVHVDEADIASWRDGRLIFENQPVAEVMRSLERTYNVHITVANERLKKEKVTMRLNHQPLINVLTALSFSSHFSFQQIDEKSVIVK